MKHIFSSIIRKALKNKAYTIINITGLSIAIALSSLLFLYVLNEYNVDCFHENKNRIYRVVNAHDGCAFTGPLLAEELKGRFPEIEAVSRVRHNDGGFYKYKNEIYDIEYDMCFDSTVFDIFSFKLIAGNKKEALQNPFSIVLTESIAKKIFGKTNPVGQTLRYNNVSDLTVTGVIQDLPINSTFTVEVILPFHVLTYFWEGDPKKPSSVLKERNNESFHTYILFKKNTDVKQIEKKITAFIDDKSFGRDFKLQQITNIYFKKNDRDRWINKGDSSMVSLLLSLAIGLLLISIVNYINLNTAITVNNLSVFGVKKLFGANIRQLMFYSVIETGLFFTVSVLLAILIVFVVKQPFFSILSANYHFGSILSVRLISLALLLTAMIALLSGIVPVHYLKRLPSVAIIQKKRLVTASTNPLNNSLIILQFLITIIFIVSALFIGKQVYYIKHKNLGFRQDLLVYVDLKAYYAQQFQANTLKEELLSNAQIKSVSYSAGIFGDVRRGMNSNINGIYKHYRRIHTDPDYVKTMDYCIIEGRDFSWDMKTDFTSEAYIINQAMANAFELKEPLNEKIEGHPIVGVVEDFHYESFHKNIQPVVLICNPSKGNWIANIRLSSNDLKGSIKHIEKIFKKLNPDQPFKYVFADDRIATYYKKEIQFSRLAIIFSIINICISCIGLIGLVLLTINRQVKEIGIRKVNGAKIVEILAMLNKNFIRWVILAFILATPIAWYAMNKWLQNFAYKTELSWWIFAVAGSVALAVTLLIVSWQSWRTATRNPVEALRYE